MKLGPSEEIKMDEFVRIYHHGTRTLNPVIVKYLLKKGVMPDSIPKEAKSPLPVFPFLLQQSIHTQETIIILNELIDHGANLDSKTFFLKGNCLQILTTSHINRQDKIRLIKKMIDREQKFSSAIFESIYKNDLKLFKQCLDELTDNERDEILHGTNKSTLKNSLFYYICCLGGTFSKEFIELLKNQYKIDFNRLVEKIVYEQKSEISFSPLILAAEYGNVFLVRYFAEMKSEEWNSAPQLNKAIEVAARYGHLSTVETLYKYDAKLFTSISDGAFLASFSSGNLKLVQYLFDLMEKNSQKPIALIQFIKSYSLVLNFPEIFEFLLTKLPGIKQKVSLSVMLDQVLKQEYPNYGTVAVLLKAGVEIDSKKLNPLQEKLKNLATLGDNQAQICLSLLKREKKIPEEKGEIKVEIKAEIKHSEVKDDPLPSLGLSTAMKELLKYLVKRKKETRFNFFARKLGFYTESQYLIRAAVIGKLQSLYSGFLLSQDRDILKTMLSTAQDACQLPGINKKFPHRHQCLDHLKVLIVILEELVKPAPLKYLSPSPPSI